MSSDTREPPPELNFTMATLQRQNVQLLRRAEKAEQQARAEHQRADRNAVDLLRSEAARMSTTNNFKLGCAGGLLVGLVFAGIYGEWMAWSSSQLWMSCEAKLAKVVK